MPRRTAVGFALSKGGFGEENKKPRVSLLRPTTWLLDGLHCDRPNREWRPSTASVRGGSEQEARQKLRQIEAEIVLGKPVMDGSIRLGRFLEEWLATTIEPNCLSVNTAASYRGIVERHLIPTLGKKRLRDLTVLDVDHLLHQKYEAD